MYRILVILVVSLLSVSNGDDTKVTLEWFYGKWFPAVIYPHTNWVPLCNWVELSAFPEYNCTCDGKEAASVFVSWHAPMGVVPAIVANTKEELEEALNQDCRCNNRHEVQGVYRRINDNYFVMYSKTASSPDLAMLMLRKMPKLSELRAVIRTIDDLKDRKPGYLCDPNYYVSEFEGLD